MDHSLTVEIDTSKPHPARMYDRYLGGKDNYPVDEAMGRCMLALDPTEPCSAARVTAFRGTAVHRAGPATAWRDA
ncbi:SAM-dependent methyltransferase [Streptomyces sp. NPDC051172]|uniref:SAM-dependent methyltransferase n=1 Tax=Streptomyces sp. NPDC051172 TaxID=3155796 RepID=UPI0034497049